MTYMNNFYFIVIGLSFGIQLLLMNIFLYSFFKTSFYDFLKTKKLSVVLFYNIPFIWSYLALIMSGTQYRYFLLAGIGICLLSLIDCFFFVKTTQELEKLYTSIRLYGINGLQLILFGYILLYL